MHSIDQKLLQLPKAVEYRHDEIDPDLNVLDLSNVTYIHHDNDDNHDIQKVGRNELCPCGSGKKYKHCHGGL
jgi:uncharacterized protein YecA (UPF0149 family)